MSENCTKPIVTRDRELTSIVCPCECASGLHHGALIISSFEEDLGIEISITPYPTTFLEKLKFLWYTLRGNYQWGNWIWLSDSSSMLLIANELLRIARELEKKNAKQE